MCIVGRCSVAKDFVDLLKLHICRTGAVSGPAGRSSLGSVYRLGSECWCCGFLQVVVLNIQVQVRDMDMVPVSFFVL